MSWDTTSPADSDFISLGDDAIRTFKTDIQTALRGNASDGTEAKFPGSDTANPIFRYRGLKGTTGARPAFGQYGLYINTTLNTIQRDSGSAWEDVATLIPSGTKMVFYQASAPTGWTAVAVNDKFLRVVTSGGTGGTTGGSGLTPSSSVTLAHSHTVNSHTHTMGNHTHSTPTHQHILDYSTNAAYAGAGGSPVISTDSNGSFILGSRSGGGTSMREHKNTTQTDGSGTSGTPSTNTSDGTAPGTDSQLSNTAFVYADVCVGTKD